METQTMVWLIVFIVIGAIVYINGIIGLSIANYTIPDGQWAIMLSTGVLSIIGYVAATGLAIYGTPIGAAVALYASIVCDYVLIGMVGQMDTSGPEEMYLTVTMHLSLALKTFLLPIITYTAGAYDSARGSSLASRVKQYGPSRKFSGYTRALQ